MTNEFVGLFALQFGPAMVAYLTTENRLQVIKQCDAASNERQASSLLQILYNAGSGAANELSHLVKKAFGTEIALDFTVPQKLQLRVGDDFSHLPADPRDARPIMLRYEQLDDQGDGIRSFIGVIISLLVLRRSLYLIDEPEAFLHPPQAFRLGSLIAEQAGPSRQIILATHSVDLLRGILSRGTDVQIVRVDRVGNANIFKQVDAERLKEIVTDPLLTSSRVLDGLFYSGAVVVEADSDARFYHAASIKLEPDLDLHFVNADNKQTVPRILRLYQDMGVRAAGIVDFDVLNDRTELAKSLKSVGVPDDEVTPLLEAQRRIAAAAREAPAEERLTDVRAKLIEVSRKLDEMAAQSFGSHEEGQVARDSLLRQMESRFRELSDATKAWKALKEVGRHALPPAAQAAFDGIATACAARGFFINPCGELESMLVEYGIPATSDKRAWIRQALQLAPGLAPNDAKHPWKFLRTVLDHIQTSRPPASDVQ